MDYIINKKLLLFTAVINSFNYSNCMVRTLPRTAIRVAPRSVLQSNIYEANSSRFASNSSQILSQDFHTLSNAQTSFAPTTMGLNLASPQSQFNAQQYNHVGSILL